MHGYHAKEYCEMEKFQSFSPSSVKGPRVSKIEKECSWPYRAQIGTSYGQTGLPVLPSFSYSDAVQSSSAGVASSCVTTSI